MMRMIRPALFCWATFMIASLIIRPLPAFAQATASLAGRISDSNGQMVPGATVTLFGRATNLKMNTLTDAGGKYRFEHLYAGDYVLEVSQSGFRNATHPVQIEKESAASLDIVLEVGGLNETVMVTASGTPQTVDEVSKAVSVVGAQEIDQRREISIAESLRTVPGLRVQQTGSPGAFTRIQSRGLRDTDTAILIDGLRLRDASTTSGDVTSFIEELFVVNPDRVEIVRGSGSSLYGSNAIGGVINIVSNQGGEPTHGELQFDGGQMGLYRGRGLLSGGFGDNRLVYSGGLALLNITDGVNGDMPTRNLSGQGFVQFNATPTIALSTRFVGNTAFLQLTDSPFAPPPGTPSLPSGSVVDAVALPLDQQRILEAGRPIVPGNANYVPNLRDPDNRRDSGFGALAVNFNQRVNQALGYRASYQRISTDREYSDGPSGVRFEPLFNSLTAAEGTIDTLSFQGEGKLGRHNFFTAGYEFERENYLGHDSNQNPDPAQRLDSGVDITQRSQALFAQNQFQTQNNRFQAAAAFRAQWFSLSQPEFFGGTSVYASKQYGAPQNAYTADGSILYFFSSSGTKVRAHVGNGYRAPSLYERFSSSFFTGVFSPYGDPGLRPDRSIAVDGGIDQRLAADRVQLSATYFYTRLQEVVVFDFTGGINPATDPFGRFGGYRNTGGGLARGLELAVTSQPHHRLNLSASYTLTNADNRIPTSVPGFLPTFVQPRHMFTLVAAQQITRQFDVVFDMFAYGSYFFPFSGTAFRFHGPVKADLAANYTRPLTDRIALRFYGKVENVFDREFFESGFRTPGTVFTAGMGVRF